jgi:hypothetical protein
LISKKNSIRKSSEGTRKEKSSPLHDENKSEEESGQYDDSPSIGRDT